MFNKVSRSGQLVSLVMIAVLTITMVAVALPSRAVAAATTPKCSAYYTVKVGDTLRSVATKYKVNLIALAKANRLSVNDTLIKGEKLCIPSSGQAEPKAVLTITAKGGKIFIVGSGFTKRTGYVAKVRQTEGGAWYRLGRLSSGEKGELNATYPVPTDLKKKLYITVCLKNQANDSLTCRSILNVP